MTKGYIHSIETCGTVDGPGLRYVIFLQGCPMRCQYCHNPDTWEPNKGDQMTVDEVLESFYNNTAFYKTGGVTVTGGEPMMQMDFLIELFGKLHRDGFHTCIDTSGIMFQPDNEKLMVKIEKLMDLTDLVMLDIKHIDDEKHKDYEKTMKKAGGNFEINNLFIQSGQNHQLSTQTIQVAGLINGDKADMNCLKSICEEIEQVTVSNINL